MTVKDDVNVHRSVLDDIGVKSIAAVVGGSMGGMLVLEYAYFGPEYVRSIVPLATCAAHSAWGISWGETQRQSIYSDPKYNDGYYTFDDPPVVGLGAARMAAMLTYRSRNSFESKFGRKLADPIRQQQRARRSAAAAAATTGITSTTTPTATTTRVPREPVTPSEARWAVHNHGHRQGLKLSEPSTPVALTPSTSSVDLEAGVVDTNAKTDASGSGSDSTTTTTTTESIKDAPQTFFSAQSYLRYQGDKFVKRFDANCYIAITRKLDSHDVSRGRGDNIEAALAQITQPTLVIGISSDGLFTFAEQEKLAENIPNAELKEIKSPEGHDAFLLEFAEINTLIVDFLRKHHGDILDQRGISWEETEVGAVGKSSLFGEAEGVDLDVTNW